MSRTPAEIVESFKASGYQHMHDIPGNRVFYTDATTSTLAWYEGRVVIEYYVMHPNVDVPLHWHPFENQMIFLNGQLTGFRKNPGNERTLQKDFTTEDCHYLGKILPINYLHGFKTGPLGATLYNIQIWPEDVPNPLSASIEYLGPGMGPIHEQMRTQK
jgi:hypothetical protein